MSDKPKYVSEAKRLAAFALYTMADQHYRKACECERALSEVLGCAEEYEDAFRDGIYGADRAEPFDRVFAGAGFAVKKKGNKP